MPDALSQDGEADMWFATETIYPVVYADTDALGIVYHGKYLEIAERSRAYTVAAVGLDQKRAEREIDARPVVNKVRIKYHEPIRLHDVVRVRSSIARVGFAHIWWLTSFFVDDQLRATVEASTILIKFSTGEIVGVPAGLLQTMRCSRDGR